jgi:hypothetical protein
LFLAEITMLQRVVAKWSDLRGWELSVAMQRIVRRVERIEQDALFDTLFREEIGIGKRVGPTKHGAEHATSNWVCLFRDWQLDLNSGSRGHRTSFGEQP